MFKIKMESSGSSVVESFGYDEGSQVLAIRFRPLKNRTSVLYHYHDVDLRTFCGFKWANSQVEFIHRNLRWNRYSRVD